MLAVTRKRDGLGMELESVGEIDVDGGAIGIGVIELEIGG